MAIVNICWEFMIRLACSIIQVFGVFIEGIGKILVRTSEYLKDAHDWLWERKSGLKKAKQSKFDVPL